MRIYSLECHQGQPDECRARQTRPLSLCPVTVWPCLPCLASRRERVRRARSATATQKASTPVYVHITLLTPSHPKIGPTCPGTCHKRVPDHKTAIDGPTYAAHADYTSDTAGTGITTAASSPKGCNPSEARPLQGRKTCHLRVFGHRPQNCEGVYLQPTSVVDCRLFTTAVRLYNRTRPWCSGGKKYSRNG
eukprot:2726147-Prymnesium_polylepis.1